MASVMGSSTAPTSLAPSSPSSGVWSRLFQHLTLRSPRSSRRLPKLRAGRFLMELGDPAEWQNVDVVLAGSALDDLGLYYYLDRLDREQPPLGWIPLRSAHIDSLEEVLMVVTNDKTWFLCADQARDASDWATEVCAVIDRMTNAEIGVNEASSTHSKQQAVQRQRLSRSASFATARELQSRDVSTRVDEFLAIIVRCSAAEARDQALKGAMSWSCVRNIAWKIWLDYIPSDLPMRQWMSSVREKRRHYAQERKRFQALRENVAGRIDDEEFVASCEASQDILLYDIFKDVRRTRGPMAFFRDPKVQALMIRVLYTYSRAHPAVSYNQGMGELLATIVYLLYIEQWPTGPQAFPNASDIPEAQKRASDDGTTGYGVFDFASKLAGTRSRTASTEKLEWLDEMDESFVYVELFLGLQRGDESAGDAFIDRDTLLRLPAFSGSKGHYYECCRDAAEELIRELTAGSFIEHDAYGLLEELMLRMAGTFCPDIVVVPIDLKHNSHHPVKPRQSQRGRQGPRRISPTGVSHESRSAELASSPLYDQMNRIHDHILSRCDPPTARALSTLGVEPQMFLLRWVRVLMAREFDLVQAWRIWDAIFSLTPDDFSFINLLCVAVVRAFREEIHEAEDATGVLLALKDVADKISADRLVETARELYDALLIAAAAEANARSES